MDDKIQVYIYIHVPKTAGTFIKKRILNSKETSKILDPFCGENYSISIKNAPTIKFVREQIKLSNDDRVGFVGLVRNPFDRVYSLWKWLNKNGTLGSVEFPSVPPSFSDFISEIEKCEYDRYHFLRPQDEFFRGSEDKYVKILRFEEMYKVKEFFESHGVVWALGKENAIPLKHYTEVYTFQMIDVIRRKYESEFETFEYSLDL